MILFVVKNSYGGVAQLARAFGSYPKGRGFNSLRRYQFKKDCDIYRNPFFFPIKQDKKADTSRICF